MDQYPVAYNETCIPEADFIIRQIAEATEEIVTERLGACRYCGQVQNLTGPIEWGADLNEHATRRCECPDARRYNDSIIFAEKRKRDREFALNQAADVIEEMFGDSSIGYGKIPVRAEIKALLHETAALIYDRRLKDATISVTSCVKVKISRSSKDKLTFQRSDMAVSKQEVDD